MKINKFLLGGIAIVLVAAFVFAASWYRREEASEAQQTASAGSDRLVRPHSPTLGPLNAQVTLVEFLDPACEACSAMHPIVKRLMKDFDGRLRLVVRYMPLHRDSAYAASLLEAARPQGKYWELMDAFFMRQSEWASHDAPRPELLNGFAQALGLDMTRLGTDATTGETDRRVKQDMEDGTALGVRQTPTFFVNGRPLSQIGYIPLRIAIEGALQ
jgi:protein-disulfide isomerase